MSSNSFAPSSPFIVGVAGGSGSGKTTFARQLANRLGDVAVVLSSDHYYREQQGLTLEQRAELNFDHPDAIDFELLSKHLRLLKDGEVVSVPEYCFSTHLRTEKITTLASTPVVILEGILLFVDDRLRELIDLRLFVDATASLRFRRRLVRDTNERGRTEESIRRQWLDTVAPMHEQFVAPTEQSSHLTIRTDSDNPADNAVAVDLIASGVERRLLPS